MTLVIYVVIYFSTHKNCIDSSLNVAMGVVVKNAEFTEFSFYKEMISFLFYLNISAKLLLLFLRTFEHEFFD